MDWDAVGAAAELMGAAAVEMGMDQPLAPAMGLPVEGEGRIETEHEAQLGTVDLPRHQHVGRGFEHLPHELGRAEKDPVA